MEPIIPDWLMQVLRRAGYCVEHALLFVKSEADEAELFEEISNKCRIFFIKLFSCVFKN